MGKSSIFFSFRVWVTRGPFFWLVWVVAVARDMRWSFRHFPLTLNSASFFLEEKSKTDWNVREEEENPPQPRPPTRLCRECLNKRWKNSSYTRFDYPLNMSSSEHLHMKINIQLACSVFLWSLTLSGSHWKEKIVPQKLSRIQSHENDEFLHSSSEMIDDDFDFAV